MPDDAKPPPEDADDTGACSGGFPRPISSQHLPPPPRLPFGVTQLPVVERERYVIERAIAQGGIGKIFRARDAQLGRPVAIKQLRFDPFGPGAERFVREVRITARLIHPSIVTMYEAGRWPSGEPFYAMQLVEGRSLAAALAEKKTLRERLRMMPHVIAAAEAMSYAHSLRIVHRDLKPSNVLVGSFGETVVIDWGLAKDLGESGAVPEPRPPAVLHDDRLTAAGAIVGTPAYMPREQAAGEPVDERADVYALGAILYHLVTGRPPYGDRTAAQVIRRVLHGPPRAVDDREPEVPADLADIIHKAMAREPAERYPSARELREELRRFAAGQMVAAHEYTGLERLRRFARKYRAAFGVAVAGFAATAVVGTTLLARVLDARDDAQRQQRAAEEAQRAALARADDLTLVQARAASARDPAEAIAWLRTLSPGCERWPAARVIAADARARGVATVLGGHVGPINDLAFSPDGRLLATSSDDHTVRVHDVQSGRSRVMTDHTDETWMLAFLPDGRALASASKDRTVRLTDLATWESRPLSGHEGPVTGLALTADGRLLASASFDHALRLWDTAAGESVTLHGPDEELRSVALSAAGRWLAAGTMAGTVALWDLDRGGTRSLGRLPAPVLSLLFSPDEETLFVALWTGAVHVASLRGEPALRPLSGPLPGASPTTNRVLALSADGRTLAFPRSGGVALLDTESGEELTLSVPEGRVTAVALSPDRRHLAAGTSARAAYRWELPGGEPQRLSGFAGQGVHVAFSPDGSALAAAGSSDLAVRLYPVERPSPAFTAHPGGVVSARFLPEAHLLVTSGRDGAGRVWDLPEDLGSPLPPTPLLLDGHEGTTAVAVSADGLTLATAGEEGTVRVWDREGRVLRTFAARRGPDPAVLLSADGRLCVYPGPGDAVHAADLDTGLVQSASGNLGRVGLLALSPAGDRLAFTGQGPSVHVWELGAEAHRVLTHHAGRVTALAFSPDGQTLATGGADHTLCLAGLRGGLLRVPVGGGGVEHLAFSPSGDTVFHTSNLDSAVRALSAATGKDLGGFTAGEGDVSAFALSPDESRLAAGTADGKVRLWDRRTAESRVVTSHGGAVRLVAWSADGRHLISAAEDGTVHISADDLPMEPAPLRAWLAQAGGPGVDGLLGRERR